MQRQGQMTEDGQPVARRAEPSEIVSALGDLDRRGPPWT